MKPSKDDVLLDPEYEWLRPFLVLSVRHVGGGRQNKKNPWRVRINGTAFHHKHNQYVNLARFVMALPPEKYGIKGGDALTVDHGNENSLDNRRENLTIMSRSANVRKYNERIASSMF